jgi:4'-phosphopantetheinyl transferase
MSRSSGLALYALAVGREVGVDLERVTAADEQVAEAMFAPGEVAALRGLPPSIRSDAFFACWTRKEAFIKARGEGLSFPLNGFEVSLAPDRPAALLAVHDDPAAAGRWSIHSLPAPDGYAAALVVEGCGGRLSCWTWEE